MHLSISLTNGDLASFLGVTNRPKGISPRYFWRGESGPGLRLSLTRDPLPPPPPQPPLSQRYNDSTQITGWLLVK